MKKMPYVLLSMFNLLLLTSCGFSRFSPPSEHFEFAQWHSSVINIYDELLSDNKNAFKHGLADPDKIKHTIKNIDGFLLASNIDTALRKNKGKKWDYMYLIYNDFEGEAIINISTFLFANKSESWGVAFNNNLGIYRGVEKFNISDIDAIATRLGISNNNILIISKYDARFNLIDTEILIGVELSETETILNLYHKDLL